ncbi:MAG: sigma-70 family RNA polymerase sigma factor [Bdellovibrionaceae bacterium]|nr:sigma-70 family RNA polymerase sigma factor [Bdellovibrionales bacterium]MCB9086611.1 sigma-70 family RNA polymerase sigma factor [Pseudobdellovibrionaceae bacterium]
MKADLELVEKVRNGNRAAFSELVTRHQRLLLRLALRMTRDLEMAEDIVQEAFIKAYQNIGRFEGRASFRSWIYQITANTAKNKLRARKNDCVDIDNINLAIPSGAEWALMEEDVKEVIQNEIDQLPDRQRTALNLRIYEDMSFKEIAQIMNCPYDTAKANYRHALMKLRHRMEENNMLRSWNEQDRSMAVAYRGRIAEVES